MRTRIALWISPLLCLAAIGAAEHWQLVSTTVVMTGSGADRILTITDTGGAAGGSNTNDAITLSLVSGSPDLLRVRYEAAPGYEGVYEDVPLTGVTKVIVKIGRAHV